MKEPYLLQHQREFQGYGNLINAVAMARCWTISDRGITLADTTLTEKYIYTSEFKLVAEYSVLCWVTVQPVLGNMINIVQVYTI